MFWMMAATAMTLTSELPFAPDDLAKCTMHDDLAVVLDTPDGDDGGEVYVPIAGVARTFIDKRDGGLGAYVKIDQGDGSYVLIAHLAEITVLDHQVVEVGQLLGYEGIEGVHNGSDVLIGHAAGMASEPGRPERWLPLSLRVTKVPGGESGVLRSDELVCDVTHGDVYRSRLNWRTRPPDDPHQRHTWVRVYGENLWIDPATYDGRWFVFPEGVYRIDLNGDPFWRSVADACDREPSDLCQRRMDGEWLLCVDSRDGDIVPGDMCL